MARVKVSIKGVRPMQGKLREARMRIERDALLALTTEGRKVMKAAHVLTPKETGALRESAELDKAERVGKTLAITMGFGRTGESAAYALAIHEHPSDASPRSWAGKTLTFTLRHTGHKFLERPLRDSANGMNERIAARIRI